MKKILLLFILIFVFFIPVEPAVFAAEPRPLEIEYPSVPGVTTTPTTVGTELPIYVKYIFNFFIWIAGIIGLGVLIIAGVRYLISAGTPAVLADAKDQIFAALAGLLILFSSWLILTTINPQLKELQKPPPVLPVLHPGVYLCKEEVNIVHVWKLIKALKELDDPIALEGELPQLKKDIEKIKEKCWLVPSSGEIILEFNDLAKNAYVVPTEEDGLYGAILYDESKYGGRSQIVYDFTPEAAGFDITAIKPSSVKTFILKKPRPEVYVELYELIDFNKYDTDRKSEKHTIDGPSGFSSYYVDTSTFTAVGSVKIEGDLIVIFFKDKQSGDWPPDAIIDVIVNTDANLYDNLMGRWCWELVWFHKEYYPCPKQMKIVSGGIY
ncbi:MAG: pilin [bacterium]|nr:pilin [bacterium]